MILLDTNVISALMREKPEPAVLDWINKQPPSEVWTTSVSVFEIRHGLGRMATGRRRRGLETVVEAFLTEDLADRIAILDRAAADAAGSLAARREAAGRAPDIRDTLIAGIALARRAAIATRNVKHFSDLDVPVIDPWGGEP
jgi:predicted nucleic acid-binding protein